MKKVLITILAFMLLISTLVTSTYAWITLARTSQVEDIWLLATLGDSLEISVDGVNYYEELPKEILYQRFKKVELLEITSPDGVNFSHIKDDVKVVENESYISIEFHFRTTSKRERDVYLANNISKEISYYDEARQDGTFVVSKGINYKSKFDFQYDIDDVVKAGETRTYHASEAIRLSTITNRNNEEVIKIFDLSENEHRSFGKTYGAYDYYNKVMNTNLVIPSEIPPTIYQLSEFDPNGPFSYDDNSKVLELNDEVIIDGITYYTGKLRLNIWLEGWDADLFDPVIADRIKIQLQFKAVRRNS